MLSKARFEVLPALRDPAASLSYVDDINYRMSNIVLVHTVPEIEHVNREIFK